MSVPGDLEKRLAALSPEKRELLLRQLAREQKTAPAAADRIAPAGGAGSARIGARFPASFSQLRLWILDRIEPGAAMYNIPMICRLAGALDRGLLARALAGVIARHESLRTVFEHVGDEPMQVVLAPAPLPLPLVDLTGLTAGARAAEAAQVAEREADRGFDLARWPLLRGTLLRLDEREHHLILVIHHIVSDGWSLGILFRELGTLYGAFSEGRLDPLPRPLLQYPDYAAWQRERLTGERRAALVAFWRERLAGAPPALELPTDRPRPAVQDFQGSEVRLALPPDLVRGLQAIDLHAGGTLFMTLLTGLQTLLLRWSGQSDLTVGTFIANRNRAEVEALTGFFINTLVLRTDLAGDPSFRSARDRVREATLAAYAHQDLPFELLIEELQPRRDPSRTPLFQVALALLNVPDVEMRVPGLALSIVLTPKRKSTFDLTFWTEPDGEGLVLILEYATALFDPPTARRLAGHFRTLLASAAASPEARLSELALLSAPERAQLLVEWNDTAAPEPTVPVHIRIAHRAAQSPGAPAVEHRGRTLTYGELDGWAESVARRLRAAGLAAEEIVAVEAHREPGLIAALLGVLRAGGAYLPLDPGQPAERRGRMLAEAGVRFLVGPAGAVPGLPAAVRALSWDADAGAADIAAGGPGAAPAGGWSTAGGARLAYVIYTSGSTGAPKGVAVTHGGLANHTASAAAELGLAPGDRVLQFAALSFDTSAEEIYPCLTAGATLVLRDEALVTSAAAFLASVARLGLTVLDLPTAYWHELAAALAEDGEGLSLPDSVRLVIVGGEKALASRLADWRRRGGAARLLNTYGPTEATIVATRSDLSGSVADAPAASDPPLGRPISNAGVLLLDRALQPVPLGGRGEIFLGGAGLARGYLGRPDLTAERFVPDPVDRFPGGRLYRTGDLGRFRSNGELEFLGRVDQQVKVRGVRVELAEVEAALLLHPEVAAAAAAARPDATGALRLAVWVVPRDPDASPARAGLRAWLRERLPEHMVPALVALLPALPRLPSGKVDRNALPEPAEGSAGEPEPGYLPPQSESERLVAGLWQEVLGVPRVSLHDNFFDLGGHSLLMVRVHGRLRSALGRELDIVDLFQRPTVAALARHLSRGEQRPSFERAQQLAQQGRGAGADRRKQVMEQMLQARKAGRPPA